MVIGWQSVNINSYEKYWCPHNPATCMSISSLCLEQEVMGLYKPTDGYGKGMLFFSEQMIIVINTRFVQSYFGFAANDLK